MNVLHTQRRRVLGLGGAVFAAALLTLPTATFAQGIDVRVAGACTGSSTSKLHLSHDNGRIQVEFEVDQNLNGKTWNVRLKDNGTLFFTGQRTTHAPDGSFEVRRLTNNLAGTDHVTARAKNPASGEVCTASANI